MKKLVLVLVLAALALLSLSAAAQGTQGKSAPPAKTAAVEKAYVCQGCDYVGDKAGKCPKCGKDLIAVDKSDISYTCDMCHVTSPTPGKCPKCGMPMKMQVKGMKRPADKAAPAKTAPGKA